MDSLMCDMSFTMLCATSVGHNADVPCNGYIFTIYNMYFTCVLLHFTCWAVVAHLLQFM